MKNISENYEFKTIDYSLSDKRRNEGKILFAQGKALPSSKGEINFEKYNQNNQSFNFNISSENTTTSNQDNNTTLSNLHLGEYNLYGNNFSASEKPFTLGKTRDCLYVKHYPYISFGKNILSPLLLILFICMLYIVIWIFFFNDSGNLLKILFNYCFIFYLISHFLAIFINPGIPSFKYHQIIKHNLQENKINKFGCSKCKKCKLIYKLKDNIGHCNKCNICYYGYERHSFWTGHCVGLYNKFFFICFVLSFWTFNMLCLTMILVKILKTFFIKQKI